MTQNRLPSGVARGSRSRHQPASCPSGPRSRRARGAARPRPPGPRCTGRGAILGGTWTFASHAVERDVRAHAVPWLEQHEVVGIAPAGEGSRALRPRTPARFSRSSTRITIEPTRTVGAVMPARPTAPVAPSVSTALSSAGSWSGLGCSGGATTTSGHDPDPVDPALVGRQPLGDRELERAAVLELDPLLDGALAERRLADERRPMPVLERAGDDLARRGAAAVDQDDDARCRPRSRGRPWTASVCDLACRRRPPPRRADPRR